MECLYEFLYKNNISNLDLSLYSSLIVLIIGLLFITFDVVKYYIKKFYNRKQRGQLTLINKRILRRKLIQNSILIILTITLIMLVYILVENNHISL